MLIDAFWILHRLPEGIDIELDHVVRRSGGRHNGACGAVPVRIVAEFAQGRHVREFGDALRVERGKDAQFGLVARGELRNVGDLGAAEVHLALTKREELVGGAAVGNGLVFEARGLGEKLRGGMVLGLHAVRRSPKVGLGLGGVDEVLHRLVGAVGAHHHDRGLQGTSTTTRSAKLNTTMPPFRKSD